MKAKYFFWVLSLFALMVSCANKLDEIEKDGQSDEALDQVDPFADGLKLTVSRRYMVTTADEQINGYLPLAWNDQAQISVNGFVSEQITLDDVDPTKAEFAFSGQLSKPYSIVFPAVYSNQPDQTNVVFNKMQICTAGKLDASTMPMCAYVEDTTAVLRHLAGSIKLSLKGTGDMTFINKIVLNAPNSKIAGGFNVNCSAVTMTANESATNEITYMIPDGLPLSSEVSSSTYLNLPAGNHGPCTMQIYDMTGGSMTVTVSSTLVNPGLILTPEAIQYKAGSEVSISLNSSSKALGYVKDTYGNPIQGVPVTDGFTIVTTDAEGYYCIDNVSTDAWFIYYSTPAEYEVAINEHGQPCFWKDYEPGLTRYDFTLKPLASGKESEFALFTYGDPQVYSDNNLKRFLNEAVPGIKAHASTFSIPVYGIGLGDVVFNTDNYMVSHQMPKMRDGFSVSSVGMPVFQTFGNHDHTEFNAQNPLTVDSRNSNVNRKARRHFEAVFGPADYSFNRGDVHIIGIKNVQYSSATTSGTNNYHGGFTDKQYEWLKQDLALVPKDKHIIICFHIPLYDCKDKTIPELNTHTNISNVMDLLGQYENVSIMSGHVHTQRNYKHSNGIWEYNAVAVSGAWWRCCISADGVPNGFNVYIMHENKMKDSYIYGYTASSSSRNHQMRLYRGNAVTGAEISGENKNGTAGYYGFNYGDDVILANVYNGSSLWTVSVYEDGEYSGDMTMLPSSQPALTSLIGDYTFGNPRRAADGVETGHDFWVTGYLMGVSGSTSSNGGYKECYHMYKYKLKNKNASIKVVAKDPWGNTYEETTITEGTDYRAAEKP